MATLAFAGIQRIRRYLAGSKILNNCGAPQILEMVIFMDISAVSEPILIK